MKTPHFFRSLQTRLIALIFALVFLTGVIALVFVSENQKANLLSATDRTVYLNVQTIIISLRNMMINGEAPILVRAMNDLKNLGEYKAVGIYRSDATSAFTDYKTLSFVNTFQNKFFFMETDRIEPDADVARRTESIKAAFTDFAPIKHLDEGQQVIEYYFPVENEKLCMTCHGDTERVRGVVHIGLSLSGVFRQLQTTTNVLALFFSLVIIILSIALALFLRRLVISPVLNIGDAVTKVGTGDFKIRIPTRGDDELSELSSRINQMIQGLEERFKLTRYVSASTIGVISGEAREDAHTEKKQLTVLFSDIRGFTSYSERNPPETVIKYLNMVLETQANIIHDFRGDIDKFVGDEIMAIFPSTEDAVRCAFKIREQIRFLDEKIKQNLFVGIGINAGEVITGHIGSSSRLEYAAIGDTVNVSARLCALAKAHEILVTAEAFKHIGAYAFGEILPDQTLKDKNEPLNVYNLKVLKTAT